ncbi:hypothetical protein [Aequorivita echinoideorum]|uniref:Uncharacterized protein n=1 Tax=Aequorivita echinoideorum TaxID=1549647 RepID=A0ABS5S3B6_9FLAO|nr:hypothetical protein [Aequorivita echinoideorum]MBT0607659.1 hypothetical protein [Aequorivita echinoideorum]
MDRVQAEEAVKHLHFKLSLFKDFDLNTVTQVTNIAREAKAILKKFENTKNEIALLNEVIAVEAEYTPLRNLDEETELSYQLKAIRLTGQALQNFLM